MTKSAQLKQHIFGKLRGQSLPEFLVAVPVFLFLILLILQMILIYRAKTILDYAAFEAARLGAVNHAQPKDIERGLINGLTPLYASDADEIADPSDSSCQGDTAWAKTCRDVRDHGYARIRIISPTQEAMQAFRERQYDGFWAIPNDNLAYRNNQVNSNAQVNVQDANILKIQVDYEFRLIVPFVDRVVRGVSLFFKDDAPDTHLESPPASDRYFRIPIRSHAVIRMQSPVYDNEPGNPKRVPHCGGTTMYLCLNSLAELN